MSRVAILGAGDVGRAIAVGLVRGGHHVTFGTRGVDRVTDEGFTVTGYRQAVESSDAVVLAVPGHALAELLAVHAGLLNGRLLLDATNNIEGAKFDQLELFSEHTPEARVARVWCSLGWENFLEPVIDGSPIDLLWCGPDGDDAELIDELVSSTGLHPVRVGDLSATNIVEYATRLVLSLIFQAGFTRALGLRILR